MLNQPRRALMAFCFAFSLPILANAQSLEAPLQIIHQAVADGGVPGGSVLVMRDGKTVAASAAGVCDIKEQRAFQTDTICWIASLTKPFTATAAMKLVERGKLKLDDPVERYLPEFKQQTTKDGRHHPITIRQLMCHSSGIPSSVPSRPRFFFQQPWYQRFLKEIPPEIAKEELDFDPGTKTHYSNAAPYVLGRIIEIQSGRTFRDFVTEEIFKPLHMNDTGFSIPPQKINRAAIVYRKEGDSIVEYCRYNPEWRVNMTMPDGGLFSTTADIAKFATMFLKRGQPILSKESVDEMLRPQSDGYGLGWILDEKDQFSHWGSSGTMVWADQKTTTVGVVFLQIQDYKRVAELHNRFRTAVTKATSGR